MRRWLRVLWLVFQPIRPSSDLVGAVQIAATVALPVLAAFIWTLTKAAFVAVGLVAVLSLWGAYKLQTQNDVLLGQTHLQQLIAEQIREGKQLLRRLKRKKKAEEVPTQLTDQIISWCGRTIRDLNEAAPDVASDVYEAHGTGLDTRDPRDQIRYVKRFVRGLEKIGRELQGSD